MTTPAPAPRVSLSPGVHSPALSTDPVRVYDKHGFSGPSASFNTTGEYIVSTSTTGIADNTISSIKVQPGWSAELFEDSTFSGKHYPYTYDQDNITNELDNKVSAIRITRTPAPAPAPVSRTPAPAPVQLPPGTITTTLPARFIIKTPKGNYITNKLYSNTSSAPFLSLDQTMPKVNFTIVKSGLYQLPANYVALKDSDISASNSGHYQVTISNYISRGSFWSSVQGGDGLASSWQFYKQSDGKYIILNNRDGVYNYLFEPSFSTVWLTSTTNLSAASKFIIEDAPTAITPTPAPAYVSVPSAPTSITPAPAPKPKTPAPSPKPKTPAPSPTSSKIPYWVWIILALVILMLVGGAVFIVMKKKQG